VKTFLLLIMNEHANVMDIYIYILHVSALRLLCKFSRCFSLVTNDSGLNIKGSESLSKLMLKRQVTSEFSRWSFAELKNFLVEAPESVRLDARDKPSPWFPRGRFVEHWDWYKLDIIICFAFIDKTKIKVEQFSFSKKSSIFNNRCSLDSQFNFLTD